MREIVVNQMSLRPARTVLLLEQTPSDDSLSSLACVFLFTALCFLGALSLLVQFFSRRKPAA